MGRERIYGQYKKRAWMSMRLGASSKGTYKEAMERGEKGLRPGGLLVPVCWALVVS